MIFASYPDVVTVKQMCSMLGGIGKKTAYDLPHNGGIRHLKLGKSFKIPKWLPTGIPVSGKKSQKQAEELLWETRHSYKDNVIRTMDAGAAHMTGNMLFADYMADWLGNPFPNGQRRPC